MATLEQILNLPPEGYEAILKMTEAELKEYLKDITKLEPDIVVEDTVEEKAKTAKLGKGKKLSGVGGKKVGKVSDAIFEDMVNDLLGETKSKTNDIKNQF